MGIQKVFLFCYFYFIFYISKQVKICKYVLWVTWVPCFEKGPPFISSPLQCENVWLGFYVKQNRFNQKPLFFRITSLPVGKHPRHNHQHNSLVPCPRILGQIWVQWHPHVVRWRHDCREISPGDYLQFSLPLALERGWDLHDAQYNWPTPHRAAEEDSFPPLLQHSTVQFKWNSIATSSHILFGELCFTTPHLSYGPKNSYKRHHDSGQQARKLPTKSRNCSPSPSLHSESASTSGWHCFWHLRYCCVVLVCSQRCIVFIFKLHTKLNFL